MFRAPPGTGRAGRVKLHEGPQSEAAKQVPAMEPQSLVASGASSDMKIRTFSRRMVPKL